MINPIFDFSLGVGAAGENCNQVVKPGARKSDNLLASDNTGLRPSAGSLQSNEAHDIRYYETARESRASTMPELKSRYLFTMTLQLAPMEDLGTTPAGRRRVFPVSGGDFKGERVRGTVLPIIGSDLLLTHPDGSSNQDVRLLLKSDDGALILMTYRGVRHASPDVDARLTRGEIVAGSEYYLRTTPFFETSSDKYSWLNQIVTVGVGERKANAVVYEIFEIL